MRLVSSLGLCGLVLACGAGCFLQKQRTRVPIAPETVAQVKPGESTIADVGRLLGSPNEIIWSNGVTAPIDAGIGAGIINTYVAAGEKIFVRAYHYRYAITKTSGFTVIVFSMVSYDTKYDDAFIFFDDAGRVTHVGSSLNSAQVSYSPFEP
jgi:hypothetical protein